MKALRTPVGAVGAALLAVVLLLAVLAPVLVGDRAAVVDTDQLLAGPSAEHWAGTDNLGRDLFLRVLVATRLSISLALLATAIAVSVGLVLGSLPWLLGPRLGRPVTALVNILVAFPGLLLVLCLATVFGVGARGAVLAIGFAGAPTFARLCQTLIAGIASRDYVAAAQIAGVGRIRILWRHVLPNVSEPLVVNATIGAGGALLAFAGLSFLGLGVQAPAYDWGRLMQDGLAGIYVHPLAALAPGIAVVIAGLAFNLTGEAIAGALAITPAVGPRAWSVPVRSSRPKEPAVAEDTVLDVRDLAVAFPAPSAPVAPVRGVSLSLRTGEAVGIVGESGSGKSLTALAIAQLVEEPGRVSGEVTFCGTDLNDGGRHDDLLGTSLAVVFQDPMTSLNPAMRVGRQLAEVSRFHQGLGWCDALARAVDRLRSVHLRDPERAAHAYPFELSGGMRQRAMIGMGLMGTPRLIIADEPTTALDVTVQKQVLALLEDVRREHGTALLLISHDVSVIGEVCDRVLVMYAGRIVEEIAAADLRSGARHPYTRALVAAVPSMTTALDEPLATIPGQPVDPAAVPPGCAYAARCPLATDQCLSEDPALVDGVACWRAGEPFPVELEKRVRV